MSSSVAAGWPLGRAYLRAILWDLKACITEPARIFYYCTRDIVRQVISNIEETARGRAILRGTGKEETVPAFKGTGTAAEESPALDEDEEYNQQHDEGDDDDDDDSGIDWDAAGRSIPDEDLGYIDQSLYLSDDDARDRLRSQSVSYLGDSISICLAHCSSRYLVELLAVCPRFHFVGNLHACDSERRSLYYCSRQRHNLDLQGNLILHAQGAALQDNFYIQVKIPEDEDTGFFTFAVDPHDCNRVIKQNMSTAGSRTIGLTFIPMHTAIQVNVEVTFDLVTATSAGLGSTICYVDGEISAHHEFYNDERVVLFSRREDEKGEVIQGKLPLSRSWAAVPITVEPLLIIKLNLRVHDHDGEGHTIPFRGDLTFYRDQYEKTISCADHGQVQVKLKYR